MINQYIYMFFSEKDIEEFKKLRNKIDIDRIDTIEIFDSMGNFIKRESRLSNCIETVEELKKTEKTENDGEKIVIYIIYKNEIPIFKRKYDNEKSGKEWWNDLCSPYDNRKINYCFNYDLSRKEKKEIISKILKEKFNKNTDVYKEEKLENYLEKCMELDEDLYRSSCEDLKEAIEKVKQLEKKIKEKEFEGINFDDKYFFKLKNIDACWFYPIMLYRAVRLKNIDVDIISSQNLCLDITLEKKVELKYEDIKQTLKKYFGRGLQDNKIDTIDKYLKRWNIFTLLEDQLNALDISDGGIYKKKWEKIEAILEKNKHLYEEIADFEYLYEHPEKAKYSLEIIEILKEISKKNKKINNEENMENSSKKTFTRYLHEQLMKKCLNELKVLITIEINKKHLTKRKVNRLESYVLRDDSEYLKEILDSRFLMPFFETIKKILLNNEGEILKIINTLDEKRVEVVLKKIEKEIEAEIVKIKIDFEKLKKNVLNCYCIFNSLFAEIGEYNELKITKKINEQKILYYSSEKK